MRAPPLDLICDIAAVIITSIALQAGHWVDVAGSGLSPAALAKIGYGVNIGLQVGLTVAAICAACLAAYHVWRLYEHGRGAANPGDHVAA